MGRIQGNRSWSPWMAAQIGGNLPRNPAPDPHEHGQTQEPPQKRMLRYSNTLRIPIAS
jgi:hypothetical protein